MIKQDVVLTATPIALERIPQTFRLFDKVNPVIQGLSSTALSMEGYTLNDIATKLPENTDGESEHTQLQAASVDRIAPVIRQSLSAISHYVIPTCDTLEKALKQCPDRNRLIDYVFNSFQIKPLVLDRNLLNSIVFDIEPDSDLLNGMLFTPAVSTNTHSIQFPELTATEIRALVKESLSYPEIAEVFEDNEIVESAFRTIWNTNYWLYKGNHKQIDVRSIEIDADDLYKLIAMNVILFKLDSDEDPIGDLTGIDLETYRRHISSLKRFIKTLMITTKRRLNIFMDQGLSILNRTATFDLNTDEYSPFNGTKVISGSVNVFVSKEMAEYFNNSEEFSLTEMTLGLVLNGFSFGEVAKQSNIVERFPSLTTTVQNYYQTLSNALNKNIRVAAKQIIQDTIISLANGPVWKDYLDSLEGTSNTNKLEKILNTGGENYNEMLTSPHFIGEVISGRIRIANTMLAVRISNGIGAPIAAEILENNLNEDCSCEEKQRKVLAKSIAKVVIKKLML